MVLARGKKLFELVCPGINVAATRRQIGQTGGNQDECHTIPYCETICQNVVDMLFLPATFRGHRR